MPFTKGSSKPPNSGRKQGTPNRRNLEVQELLARLDCDPIEGMVLIAQGKVPCGVCMGAGKTKYQPAHGHDKLLERTCESCYGSGKEKISPELKGRMLAEIAHYHRPKRKAIEHTVEQVGSIAETLRQRRQERLANQGTVIAGLGGDRSLSQSGTMEHPWHQSQSIS